jgi:threonine/homoserine/homoserine lactone efflux protein
MNLHILLKSVVLGLSIAAPVGPIGVLCIRRSMVEGAAAGLICGLGAATADAIYGALGGSALTGFSTWLVRGHVWMTVTGSAFLIYLGARTFMSAPADPARAAAGTAGTGGTAGTSAATAYFSTLLLTLANPLTILSFAGAFAGMGTAVSSGVNPGAAVAITMFAGVFGGSALWWLALTTLGGTARGRLSTAFLTTINRLSGLVLVGFGLFTLATWLSGSGL